MTLRLRTLGFLVVSFCFCAKNIFWFPNKNGIFADKTAKMNISKLVQELDNLIVKGDIMGAFDAFFHPDVTTHYSPTDKTVSKTEKKSRLQVFLNQVASAQSTVLHNSSASGLVSFSEFTFRFTHKDGNTTVWNEVIRRLWQDNLVIDEKYYLAEPTETPIKEVTKRASVKSPTPFTEVVSLPKTPKKS